MRNKEKESVENRSMKHYRDFLVLYMRSHLFRKVALFVGIKQAALLPASTKKIVVQTDAATHSTGNVQDVSGESTSLLQSNHSDIAGDGCDTSKRHLWIHGQAIPLGDSRAISRAIRIEGFFSGLRGYTDGIWPTIFYSLLAHDFYSYGLNVDGRYGNTWQKILLGSSSNQVTLTSYLNSFWWWQLTVCGAPFLFSATQMLRQLQSSSRFRKEISRVDSRNKVTSFSSLNFMTTALRWVSFSEADLNDEYHPYFSRILQTVECRHGLRKLYALSCLAEIVASRDEKDLEKLRSLGVGVDELKKQRSKALDILCRNANFYLPVTVVGEVKSQFSLIRYLYANYLLWSVGEGIRPYLDPAFLAFILSKDAVVLYAKLRLLFGLGDFAYETATFWLNKQHCLSENKVWVYVPAIADYECTVCGNWRDIYYPDMFSAQRCLDAVLSKPRSTEEVLSLAHQLSYFNLTKLDLSHQNWTAWDENTYSQIMRAFANQQELNKIQNRSFLELNLVNHAVAKTPIIPVIPEGHARIINTFLQNVTVYKLRLSGYNLTTAASAALLPSSEYLPAGAMTRVDLSNDVVSSEDLAVILECLPNSTTYLSLAKLGLTDTQMLQIAPAVSHMELTSIEIDGNKLSLSGVNNLCAYLGSGLQKLDASGNDFSQGNFTAFAKYLSSSAITKLSFGSANIGDANFAQLFSYAPYENLQYVDFSHNRLGAIAISQLVGKINGTDMVSMSFAGNLLSDKGVTVLSQALLNSQVESLDISGTSCGDVGIRGLSANLPLMALKFLNVSHNSITMIGIQNIANVIPGSHLETIDFSSNKIYDTGAAYLGQMSGFAPNRTLNLYLASNYITVCGAVNLANLLPYTSTLDLSQNDLGDAGINVLTAHFNASILLSFKVASCGFSAQGAMKIIQALPATTMRELDLSSNPIGDQVALELAEAMITSVPCAQKLANQYLSRDELRAISQTKAALDLKQLNLNATNVTTATARALCRVLPVSNFVSPEDLSLAENSINPQQVDPETCVTSAGSSVYPFGIKFTVRAVNIWQPRFTSKQLIYSYNSTETLNTALYLNSYHTGYLDEYYQYLRVCFDLLPQGFTQEMLRSLLAVALGLRQELVTQAVRMLPDELQLLLQRPLPTSLTPGYQLLSLAAELIVRAQNTGISALVYDATLVTKYAYQKQAEQEQHENATNTSSKTTAEKLTQIATNTFFGGAALAGAYGLARAVVSVTGSSVIGCLVTSLVFRAKKIAYEVSGSYQANGLFSAMENAIDQVAFSFPGGGLIEQSLQQQSAAVAKLGFFARHSSSNHEQFSQSSRTVRL